MLKNFQSEVNVTKQEKVDITKESLKKILGRMLKNFSSLCGRVKSQLRECLESDFVPGSLTKGRTGLLQKDKNKGHIASNYRPITCLSLMWK